MNQRDAKVLFSAKEIHGRVNDLGKQISLDFKDQDLVVIGVLKGSIIFCADLVRSIDLPLVIDFIGVSSYEGTKSSQRIKLTKDLNLNIENKAVLIVEDIIDTGLTMTHLIELLKERKPSEIKVCTLLSKPSAREVDCQVDYVGFHISNEFVVGYGLDYNENYRNWPFIAKLNS